MAELFPLLGAIAMAIAGLLVARRNALRRRGMAYAGAAFGLQLRAPIGPQAVRIAPASSTAGGAR